MSQPEKSKSDPKEEEAEAEEEEEEIIRKTWAKSWEKSKGIGSINIANVVTKGRKDVFEDRSEAVYRNTAFEKSKVKVKPIGWIAVYDGHGGSRAAKFLLKNFEVMVVDCIIKGEEGEKGEMDGIVSEEPLKGQAKRIAIALRRAFLDVDMAFFESPVKSSSCLCFKAADHGDSTGSTIASCILNKRYLFCAHAGDSRIMLVRSGKIHYESVDHVPSHPEELKRIQMTAIADVKDGVMFNLYGMKRMDLNVSRGIGDFKFKKDLAVIREMQPIIPDPHIEVIRRTKEDEFMVIATDGLWDFMSSEEVKDFVAERINEAGKTLVQVADELVEYCCKDRQSTDNVTVMLVRFGKRPAQMNAKLQSQQGSKA